MTALVTVRSQFSPARARRHVQLVMVVNRAEIMPNNSSILHQFI
jgi:hypothetical protein